MILQSPEDATGIGDLELGHCGPIFALVAFAGVIGSLQVLETALRLLKVHDPSCMIPGNRSNSDKKSFLFSYKQGTG
jgi:hypothetical protein